ncbi:MAG: bifunctional phosphoribosylaminoimidazolecarboxamide formyltransferase/IMP cyclohydrolase [Bacteroidales bacterium]|jgi:phosphoribosylaminoimidazolecarboxamide formyltransferase/IMP cyclohydrolase|nr:bifunctional phosphoribosylaminoimidazolecarboxamide formyltransferase/IMP cyclohydrolase [Bacteroidales bacterium]
MRALISVSDKTGVVEFAGKLAAMGWEIISTSGTMKMLKEAGVKVTSVSDVTGFPEICDGRVKTLHPKIHGALLARRDIPEHMAELKANGIETIDLVCVNLYPFCETIAKPDVTMEDAIEHIDIGGPSMLRSSAKNWESVTVVCDPSDYNTIIDEITAEGNTTRETRLRLSAKAYTHTAEYDIAIATYMRSKADLPEKLFLEYDIAQELRYGENPHQSARFYKSPVPEPYSLATAEQLNGKELSYNNIQDANAALNIVREFTEPFCVGLKHMNPCGSAVGADIVEAWKKTYEGDKTSIYGGIVAANREINLDMAKLLKPIFLEIVMAPSFAPDALELLRTKKNLRVLKVDMTQDNVVRKQFVSMNGGLLVQDRDSSTKSAISGTCATEVKPTEAQLADLDFAWHIVKHVKSNAIVVAKGGMTYGVGAGQMNRVGSAEIALKEAGATLKAEGLDIRTSGLVMASDGFFPFDDCVAMAAEYGITAIVQPGGSIRDEDSIKKCNDCGISMIFTGERHFKH